MNVLVVDDEYEIRDAIALVLKDQGHTITEAGNGVEALNRLDQPPPGGYQLILLDLTMPTMDGEQFLAALSERPESARMTVIVMTASQRIPTSVIPVQILRKPLELDHLLRLVHESRPPALTLT